jgi:hypothetical protein
VRLLTRYGSDPSPPFGVERGTQGTPRGVGDGNESGVGRGEDGLVGVWSGEAELVGVAKGDSMLGVGSGDSMLVRVGVAVGAMACVATPAPIGIAVAPIVGVGRGLTNVAQPTSHIEIAALNIKTLCMISPRDNRLIDRSR